MRSVADDFRRRTAQAVAALSVGERIELALRLGEEDVALFCALHRVSEAAARERFARARAAGRVPSVANALQRR